MEEQKCFRCDVSASKAMLYDAVLDNEIVKICERCAETEDVPIVRKPTTYQLRESEKPYSVYDRLTKLAGVQPKAAEVKSKGFGYVKLPEKTYEHVTIDSLRKVKKEYRKPLNLIDNFHWDIQMIRRKKGLNQRQLADLIGESEAAIKMIEKAQLPDDAEELIKKLEQFFRIKLTKDAVEEKKISKPSWLQRIQKEQEREELIKVKQEAGKQKVVDWMTLLEKRKKKLAEVVVDVELEKTEEETELEQQETKENAKEEVNKIDRKTFLNLEKEKVESLTIDDLKKMKQARELARKEKYSRLDIEKRQKAEKISADDIIWKSEKQIEKKIEEDESMIGEDIELEED